MVHELIGDDRVVPDFFLIENHSEFVPFGLPFNRQESEESVGYHVIPVIEDLEDDFSKLKKSTWTFGTKEADAWKAQVEDVFGDILPVQVPDAAALRGADPVAAAVHVHGDHDVLHL